MKMLEKLLLIKEMIIQLIAALAADAGILKKNRIWCNNTNNI